MHTAGLEPDMFAVSNGIADGGPEVFFPDWDRHDRFGIVVHEVWGAIGASLLIQATVAEFFRARRALGLPDMYPEIYAFHVGRDFGNLSLYDFWPHHKEIVVENHPTVVLQAINDRAITRLAIPQGPPQIHDFVWPELASARDRIRTCIEYGADGIVDNPDIIVRSTSTMVEANTVQTLNLLPVLHAYSSTELPDERRWVGSAAARMGVTSEPETAIARQAHARKLRDGWVTEAFRSSNLDMALARLV